MGSVSGNATAVARYAMRKIVPLQRAYLGKGGAVTAARASLARLRRLGTTDDSAWFSVGRDLFEDWPEDELGMPYENSRPFRAICAALQLYALHQQSKDRPMAIGAKDEDASRRRGGFGAACRRIELDLEAAKGVRRRLMQVEAADDLEGMLYPLRALVGLMRAKDIPLDYGALARDLYLVQIAASKGSVFARWSREYYLVGKDEDGAPAGPSDREKTASGAE